MGGKVFLKSFIDVVTNKQANWVTSQIHTPPEAFGKLMSEVKSRMAVTYHYWDHRDFELDIYNGVRKTYDEPLTMSDYLTGINVKKDNVEVQEVTFHHEFWPQGTGKEWGTAPSGEPATGLSSDWLTKGKIEGTVPPPTQPIE